MVVVGLNLEKWVAISISLIASPGSIDLGESWIESMVSRTNRAAVSEVEPTVAWGDIRLRNVNSPDLAISQVLPSRLVSKRNSLGNPPSPWARVRMRKPYTVKGA